MGTGIIIDGYELTGIPPPPNTNFPLKLPFASGTWGSAQTFTPKMPRGNSFSKSYEYRNTFNWNDTFSNIEIYDNFSFTVTPEIIKPDDVENPAHSLSPTLQQPVYGVDELGNTIQTGTQTVSNPAYSPIPYNWYNYARNENIISVKCVNISTPRRPRFLDHITLSDNGTSCTVSGFYDMMPTGIIKYFDRLSSDKISTPVTLADYDITECPEKSDSEIFYWTNDLTYSITYTFVLTTSLGTKRSYSTTHVLSQDWTRIRDWVVEHYNNATPTFVAADSAYSFDQIIGDSGK